MTSKLLIFQACISTAFLLDVSVLPHLPVGFTTLTLVFLGASAEGILGYVGLRRLLIRFRKKA